MEAYAHCSPLTTWPRAAANLPPIDDRPFSSANLSQPLHQATTCYLCSTLSTSEKQHWGKHVPPSSPMPRTLGFLCSTLVSSSNIIKEQICCKCLQLLRTELPPKKWYFCPHYDIKNKEVSSTVTAPCSE